MTPSSTFLSGRSLRLLLPLACIICLGCEGLFSTPIKKILDNPREFEGKEVVVSGEVSDAYALLVMKSFTVKDTTGRITVITNKALPKKGTTVTVKGTVREAFAIGDAQLIVIMEADR